MNTLVTVPKGRNLMKTAAQSLIDHLPAPMQARSRVKIWGDDLAYVELLLPGAITLCLVLGSVEKRGEIIVPYPGGTRKWYGGDTAYLMYGNRRSTMDSVPAMERMERFLKASKAKYLKGDFPDAKYKVNRGSSVAHYIALRNLDPNNIVTLVVELDKLQSEVWRG